jgi:transporter family-2 protein
MDFIWYLLAIISGIALPTQSGINTQLRQTVGHPILASLISFSVGMLSLIVTFFLTRNQFSIADLQNFSKISWWKWTGGLLGAYMVSTAIFVTPKIGAANSIALIVAGQMTAAILYDHFGSFGFAVHPVSLTRIVGAILLITGVILIVKS